MKYDFGKIIGYKEEKEELEIVAASLERMAAEPNSGKCCPKGLLLCGEPGLGKTLFAKTLIDEVGLPTYEIDGTSLSGSLGRTCSNIKATFRKAKRKKTAIIFIDEVGRITTDSSFHGFESDMSRTVLSCLLSNMEGIDDKKNIFVIMTANNPGSLDPALIRPGRIDKVIEFNPPVYEDRKELFQKFVAFSPEFDGVSYGIDFGMLAKKTEGFSCAAIKSLVAEVGLMLCSGMVEGSKRLGPGVYDANVTKTFLDRIFYALGVKKTSTVGMPKDALRRTIVHEIGHAIVKHATDGKWSDIVINSANRGSVGGLTHFISDGWEDPYATKQKVLNDVAVCLAGRAAEEMFMGGPSGGCSEDLSDAKKEILGAMEAGLFGFEAVNYRAYEDLGCPEAVDRKRLSIFRVTMKKAYKCAIDILAEPKSLYLETEMERALLDHMMISAEEIAKFEKGYDGNARTTALKPGNIVSSADSALMAAEKSKTGQKAH